MFNAGDYYRARGVQLPEPAFLDQVVLRFGIASADDHYHVPLLISPYSYSTYRGSWCVPRNIDSLSPFPWPAIERAFRAREGAEGCRLSAICGGRTMRRKVRMGDG